MNAKKPQQNFKWISEKRNDERRKASSPFLPSLQAGNRIKKGQGCFYFRMSYPRAYLSDIRANLLICPWHDGVRRIPELARECKRQFYARTPGTAIRQNIRKTRRVIMSLNFYIRRSYRTLAEKKFKPRNERSARYE